MLRKLSSKIELINYIFFCKNSRIQRKNFDMVENEVLKKQIKKTVKFDV